MHDECMYKSVKMKCIIQEVTILERNSIIMNHVIFELDANASHGFV